MVSIAEILGFIQSAVMMIELVISGLQSGMKVTSVATNSKSSLSESRPSINSQNLSTESTESSKNVCQSPACHRAAQELAEAMDKTIDPCEDFFAYTCNNWIKQHPLPADKSKIFVLLQLDDVLKNHLLGALNDSSYDNAFKSKEVAKQFFQRCVNEDETATAGLTAMFSALGKTISLWPPISPEWNSSESNAVTDYLYRLSKHYAAHPLLTLEVRSSLEKSSEMVIYVGIESVFGTDIINGPTKYLHINGTLDLIRTVVPFILKELNITVTPQNEVDVSKDAAGIMEWMIFLSNISLPAVIQRNPTSAYRKMTFGQLKMDYFSRSSIAKNLTNLFQGILISRNSTFQLQDTIDIYVENPEAFRLLDERLLDTEGDLNKLRNMINFLGWKLLEHFRPILPFAIRDLFEAYHRKVLGTSAQQARWKDCINYAGALFTIPVGALYVEKAVKNETRDLVQQIVKDVKEAFRQIIINAVWMESVTKEQAIAKLDNMAEYILYPDWFLDQGKMDHDYIDVDVHSSLFDLAATGWNVNYQREIRNLDISPSREDQLDLLVPTASVNAYYGPSLNALAITAGIAQVPVIDAEVPGYINYARLGEVIGHEITHGFDDAGSMYDKDGNLRNWWTPMDTAEYQKRAMGIVRQYDAYLTDTGMHINGNLTQGENIADSGGLNAARMAYRQRVTDKGPDKLLPGFEDFTVDQLFFLSFGFSWCGQYRPETQNLLLLSDPHSPLKYRVNGVAANTPEFASTFNCKANGSSSVNGVW